MDSSTPPNACPAGSDGRISETSHARLRTASDVQAPESCSLAGEGTPHLTRTVTGREYASIPAEDSGASFTRPSKSPAEEDVTRLERSQQRAESPGKLGTLGAWLFEVLSLLVSIASFAAIVALLVVYDKKPRPEFAYSLNINTFIAIFTTILQPWSSWSLVSKWQWMTSPRPLRDIEVFDNAGRGAWGSLRLLFFSWKPIAAILSAFVILTSYAIGPFSQQAVKTYTCEVPADGAAEILSADWVGLADFNLAQVEVKAALPSPGMRINMIYGLVQGVANVTLRLSECESSNCTFESASDITHQSVGVCSTCVDLRDRLVEKEHAGSLGSYDSNTAVAFRSGPNGTSGVDQSIEPVIFDMATEETPEATKHDLDPESGTVNTTIITFTTHNCTTKQDADGKEVRDCNHDYENMPGLDQDVDIAAANCSLYPCLRKYHGEIVNGVLSEALAFTEPMTRALNMTDSETNRGGYMIMAEPCLVGDKWYDSTNISQAPRSGTSWTSWTTRRGVQDAPSECVRGMEFEAFMAIEHFLSHNFQGSCRALHGRGSQNPSTALREARFFSANHGLLVVACWGSFRDREMQPVWMSAILPLMSYDLVPDRKSLEESGERRLQLKQLESLAYKTIIQL